MVTKFHTKIFKYQQKLYSLELQRGRSFVLNPLVDLVCVNKDLPFLENISAQNISYLRQ